MLKRTILTSSVCLGIFSTTASAVDFLPTGSQITDAMNEIENIAEASVDAYNNAAGVIGADFSGMFSAGCSMITDDPSMKTLCENYSATYVTDLAPSELSSLITANQSSVIDTLNLMGLSQITSIADLSSLSFSEIITNETFITSDDKLSESLTTIVEGRYSQSFLAGLSEDEKIDLYESEWDNLRNLMDLSGVGGSSASASSIDLEESKTETIDVVTTITELIPACNADFLTTGCFWFDEFSGYTLVGLPGGTISKDFEGSVYLTYSSIKSTAVTTTHVYNYAPNINSNLSGNTITTTHTTQAESYKPNRETMSTIDVGIATMDAAFNCFSWTFRGVCIWLKWSWTGPTLKTSVKVRNYVPELTFQTYTDATKPPWDETRSLMNAAQVGHDGFFTKALSTLMGAQSSYKEMGGGKGRKQGNPKARNESNFKLVDAFGNPAADVFKATFGNLEAFCVPNTTMFYPYYISNMDAINWRQYFGVEFWNYRSWLVGAYNLGTYSDKNIYGSVYPRIGFNSAEDEVKAAVLATYRAAHFITREDTWHVVNDIYIPHKKGLWVDNELDFEHPNTGKFQQLLPYTESKCQSFPLKANPDGKRRGETGATMWNFWRRVSCCKKRGSKLLFPN